MTHKILGEDGRFTRPFELLAWCTISITFRQIQSTAEVIPLKGKHRVLEIGIADVGMRVMNDENITDFCHNDTFFSKPVRVDYSP